MNKKIIPEKLYQKIIDRLPICCIDLVIKKNKSFLLVKRLKNPARKKWWFPGGRVFFNESLEDAARRKLREELNIKKIHKIKFLGVGEAKFNKGLFNKPIHSIANVFLVNLTEKECLNIKSDQTIISYRWFRSVQKGFHPFIKRFLKSAGF